MNGKQRLSASVDGDLIAAAEEAVARGRFDSVSAWVNDALRLKLTQERKLEALARFVAAYEGEFGHITDEEIESAARRARGRATPVRGARQPKKRLARGRRRAG